MTRCLRLGPQSEPTHQAPKHRHLSALQHHTHPPWWTVPIPQSPNAASNGNPVLTLPTLRVVATPEGVSISSRVEESLWNGPFDAQFIPISTGRSGSGTLLLIETPDAQPPPSREAPQPSQALRQSQAQRKKSPAQRPPSPPREAQPKQQERQKRRNPRAAIKQPRGSKQ